MKNYERFVQNLFVSDVYIYNGIILWNKYHCAYVLSNNQLI